jgi:hypothetical protein
LLVAAPCDGRTEDQMIVGAYAGRRAAGTTAGIKAEAEPLRALPHCSCQKERFSEMVRIDALAASFRLAYCTISRSTRVASCCSRWRNACSSAMK